MPRDYSEPNYKVGAARLGLNVDVYRRYREAGFRWCSGHGRFESDINFRCYPKAGWRSYCIEAERTRSREYQRAKWAAIRDERASVGVGALLGAVLALWFLR